LSDKILCLHVLVSCILDRPWEARYKKKAAFLYTLKDFGHLCSLSLCCRFSLPFVLSDFEVVNEYWSI